MQHQVQRDVNSGLQPAPALTQRAPCAVLRSFNKGCDSERENKIPQVRAQCSPAKATPCCLQLLGS